MYILLGSQIRLPNGKQLRKKLKKTTTLGQLWNEVLDEEESHTEGYCGFIQVNVTENYSNY